VPAVVDAVDPVPVIAAGGVGDGRGLAAVLALGAAAAWVGTAFVVAEESGAHPSYQDAITTADETGTSYSVLFDGGWTDAPHRTLTTAQVRAWEEAGRPASGARPGEDDVVANEGTRAIRRYAADVPTAGIDGDIGSLPHYAGQSAGLVTTREPAAVIVERISTEAAATLQGAIAPQESGPAVQRAFRATAETCRRRPSPCLSRTAGGAPVARSGSSCLRSRNTCESRVLQAPSDAFSPHTASTTESTGTTSSAWMAR
jgi:nitronate monooxygenase